MGSAEDAITSKESSCNEEVGDQFKNQSKSIMKNLKLLYYNCLI